MMSRLDKAKSSTTDDQLIKWQNGFTGIQNLNNRSPGYSTAYLYYRNHITKLKSDHILTWYLHLFSLKMVKIWHIDEILKLLPRICRNATHSRLKKFQFFVLFCWYFFLSLKIEINCQNCADFFFLFRIYGCNG